MKSTTYDLRALKQTQVAWLIGRPTHWVRANGYLFERNSDGTYNAQQVVAAMLAKNAPSMFVDFDPIDLSLLDEAVRRKEEGAR